MKKAVCFIVASLCMVVFLFGCTGAASMRNVMMLNTVAERTEKDKVLPNDEVFSSYNAFSYDFFRIFNEEKANDNVCLSPFSAYMAFAMCYMGAEGNTASEFEKVFGMNKSASASFGKEMYDYILQRKISDKSTKINLANSVWLDKKYAAKVKDSYLETVSGYFNAPVFASDFSDRNTVNAINYWCKENTDGLIKEIIEKLDKNQFIAIINALLLETAWEIVYQNSDIVKDEFKNLNGEKSTATYLSKEIGKFFETDGMKAIEMTLRDGFSFIGILPDEDVPFETFCKGLTGQKFEELMKNGNRDYRVRTKIPTFTTDSTFDLIDGMKKLGIESAFNNNTANFSSMATFGDGNVYLSEAIQKTHFELDKTGIKAAAVTYIAGKTDSAIKDMRPIVNIYLDRPFVYVIADTETKLPLFIGAVKGL